MNRLPYSTPDLQLFEALTDDILTVSSGEKLDLDGNGSSGYGVFKWLNV